MFRDESLHHRTTAKILVALGRQVHLMPALGKRRDHRLVVAEIREVARDEENLHAWQRHGRGRPVSARRRAR